MYGSERRVNGCIEKIITIHETVSDGRIYDRSSRIYGARSEAMIKKLWLCKSKTLIRLEYDVNTPCGVTQE